MEKTSLKFGFLTFNLGDLNIKGNMSMLGKSEIKSVLFDLSTTVDVICVSTQEDSPESKFISWVTDTLTKITWKPLYITTPMHSANRGAACGYTSKGDKVLQALDKSWYHVFGLIKRHPFVVHLAVYVKVKQDNNFKITLSRVTERDITKQPANDKPTTCEFHVIRHKKLDNHPKPLIRTYYDKSSVVAVIEYRDNNKTIRFAVAGCHFPFNKKKPDETNNIEVGKKAVRKTIEAFQAADADFGFIFGDLNFRNKKIDGAVTQNNTFQSDQQNANTIKSNVISFKNANTLTCPVKTLEDEEGRIKLHYMNDKRARGSCDRVLVWPNKPPIAKLLSMVSVIDKELSGENLSDHLPVVAKIEINIGSIIAKDIVATTLLTEPSNNATISDQDIAAAIKADLDEEAQEAGSNKIHILGRWRKIHIKNNKQYIIYNKNLITLNKAKKLVNTYKCNPQKLS